MKLKTILKGIFALSTLFISLHVMSTMDNKVEAVFPFVSHYETRSQPNIIGYNGLVAEPIRSGTLNTPMTGFRALIQNWQTHGVGIRYQGFDNAINNWRPVNRNGENHEVLGTCSNSYFTAFSIALENVTWLDVHYRVRQRSNFNVNIGWSPWVKNGEHARVGGAPIDAIQMYVFPNALVNLPTRIFVDPLAVAVGKTGNQATIDAMMANFAFADLGVNFNIATLGTQNNKLNGNTCGKPATGVVCDSLCGTLANCNNALAGNNHGHHRGATRLRNAVADSNFYTLSVVGHVLCAWGVAGSPNVHKEYFYGLAKLPGKDSIVTTFNPNITGDSVFTSFRSTIQHEWTHNLSASTRSDDGHCDNVSTLSTDWCVAKTRTHNRRRMNSWCGPCETDIRIRKLNGGF